MPLSRGEVTANSNAARYHGRMSGGRRRRRKRLPPVHPGEVLLEEFLLPLGLSQYRVAKASKVPPRRINEIVLGKRAISADTALRLARCLGTSPEFWMNLQATYDLERAREHAGASIVSDVTPLYQPR